MKMMIVLMMRIRKDQQTFTSNVSFCTVSVGIYVSTENVHTYDDFLTGTYYTSRLCRKIESKITVKRKDDHLLPKIDEIDSSNILILLIN